MPPSIDSKFNLAILFIYSLFLSVFNLVLQRCPSQWPLLWSHCSFTKCIPRPQKIDRTKITSCIHCTIPEEYSATKKDSNTKKTCQKNIVNQNSFDALNNHIVISRPLTKRELCRASCNEYRSNYRNNISCGDNLRFI